MYKNLLKSDAENKEIELIKEYKSNDQKFGYNICSGGNGTPSHKMKKASIEKMRAKLKKVMNTPEMKKILSETHSGKNNKNYGKHLSEETKRKISISEMGCIKKGKSVVCIETSKVYRTILEAGKDTKTHFSSIGEVCSGKRKTANKLHWKYINK